ncbi:MAG: MMPL family transporter, partial [Candidatus Neomarinimicrobiota bacterium]
MKQQLIHWTTTRPRQAVALALALSIALASGLRSIHIEDDIMKMLPGDLPSRLVWDEIEEQFGSTEPLLVTVGNEGQSIYRPEFLADVWDLTRALEALPIVDEVQGLASISKLESVDGFLEVDDLMPARDLSPEELAQVKRYVDDNPDIAGMLVSPAGDFTLLAVVPLAGTSDAELALQVQAAQEELQHGHRSQISGMPFIRGVMAEVVRGDVISLMRVGLLVLALILLVNLRSLPGLMMVLAVMALSTAAMMGFFGWMYYLTESEYFNFTLLNSTMPVILLTIATADGVHIMTRFFREVRQR